MNFTTAAAEAAKRRIEILQVWQKMRLFTYKIGKRDKQACHYHLVMRKRALISACAEIEKARKTQ